MSSDRLRQLYERRKAEIAPLFRTSNRPRPIVQSAAAPKPVSVRPTLARTAPRIPAQPRSLETRVNSMRKLHGVYREIIRGGYFIPSANELVYGRREAIPLDEAANQTMDSSKVMYNAGITFTLLTSFLQDCSMIAFGKTGTGKTTLAEYVSSAVFNLPIRRIQQATIIGHPELTEEKMVAMFDVIMMLNKERKLIVRDFVKEYVRIIDEVNRIPPKTLSILYQLIDRGWTTYQGNMIVARPAPLFVTANPPDEGNFRLPEPFVDRFDIGEVFQSLDPFEYENYADKRQDKIRRVSRQIVEPPVKLSEQDLVDVRKTVYAVEFPSELVSMLAHFSAEIRTCDMAGVSPEKKTKSNTLYKKVGPLCQDCDHYTADNNVCSRTENDLSSRSLSTIFSYAKALAAWRGSDRVNEDDLKYAIAYGSWFKLRGTRKAFEDEPRHFNDRIAWVLGMYDMTKHSYDEVCAQLPEYRNITQLFFAYALYQEGRGPRPSIGKADVKHLFEEAAKLDSQVKFPLMASLNKLYLSLK